MRHEVRLDTNCRGIREITTKPSSPSYPFLFAKKALDAFIISVSISSSLNRKKSRTQTALKLIPST